MSQTRVFATSLVFLALVSPAFADETAPEVVVTATRSGGSAASLYGGSATVVSPEQLEARQTRTVSDILRDVPGIAVSRLGGAGTQTQIRIRGTESNHTLVLIDGIEASDPFQGEFDFSNLIADDVARIEVLRGAQSALYGSDAIGGVVHYITASGAEAPGVRGRAEGGTPGSFDAAARWAGVVGSLDYAVSGAYSDTDGSTIARNGREDDGARARTLSARLSYDATDTLKFRAVGRYTGSKADTDPQDFLTGFVTDATGYQTRQQARHGLVGASLSLFGGAWTHDLSAQVTDVARRNDDPAFSFFTDGRREKISYVSSVAVRGEAFTHEITGAIDHERETYRNVPVGGVSGPENLERSLEATGYVAQYRLSWRNSLGLGAAARFDANDRFDDSATWRADASYVFASGVRVHAAAGTGVKNPTNFELFGFDPTSFRGNPSLKPETSTGWEAGAEHSVGAATFGATYFSARLKDEIFTRFGGPPLFLSTVDNRGTKSKQQGVETFARFKLGAGLSLDATYTWLDATENGVTEVRRPEDIASLNLDWRREKASAFLTVRYNGEAEDDAFITFPATRVTLKRYTLVNLGGEYRVTPRFSLYGRVENALDERYEDVFSYATPGAAGYLGVRSAF